MNANCLRGWIPMIKAPLLIMLALLAATASAGQVIVLSLAYDHGAITLLNSTVMTGFAPDRRIQPVPGYTVEIHQKGLAPRRFTIGSPNIEIIEGSDENGNFGGK